MMNALGQRVEDVQPDGSYTMTLTYPRDIFGHRIGIWDQRPRYNWTGWDVYWARVAGQRLNMGGSSSWLAHSDAVGSTTMETDPSGAVLWDVTRFPWGQIWQQTGTRPSAVFAGLDWEVNDPLIPSATREYNNGIGRCMTPDPGGRKVVKLNNPQTWNMYAYVGDNPTSRNDPNGLYICQGTKDGCEDTETYYRALVQAGQNAKAGSKERRDIKRALKALGKPGERNGVTISIVNSSKWEMYTKAKDGKETITIALGTDKHLLARPDAAGGAYVPGFGMYAAFE